MLQIAKNVNTKLHLFKYHFKKENFQRTINNKTNEKDLLLEFNFANKKNIFFHAFFQNH